MEGQLFWAFLALLEDHFGPLAQGGCRLRAARWQLSQGLWSIPAPLEGHVWPSALRRLRSRPGLACSCGRWPKMALGGALEGLPWPQEFRAFLGPLGGGGILGQTPREEYPPGPRVGVCRRACLAIQASLGS